MRLGRSVTKAVPPALLLALLHGCASVHTTQGDVDTLSFSPFPGLLFLAIGLLLLVPGVFFLFTPPRPGAARGMRKGGGALLLLFGIGLLVLGVWRLSWRVELRHDRIVLGSLFGHISIPYGEIQEVKVREYQNRWRPGTLWVTIVLKRTDGTEVSLPYTTLSAEHQKFLEDVLSTRHGRRAGGGDGPLVPAGHVDAPPVVDVAMEARPPVDCLVLTTQLRAFCTVCSESKRLDDVKIPGFTCRKCHRRNLLKYYSPPDLVFLGVRDGKAVVEKDGKEYSSGYGEEAVPGTGILNEGYRDKEQTLVLLKVDNVKFTDFRKDPPEEVVRPVKLQWELERR